MYPCFVQGDTNKRTVPCSPLAAGSEFRKCLDQHGTGDRIRVVIDIGHGQRLVDDSVRVGFCQPQVLQADRELYGAAESQHFPEYFLIGRIDLGLDQKKVQYAYTAPEDNYRYNGT